MSKTNTEKTPHTKNFIQRFDENNESTPSLCIICYLNLKSLYALMFAEDLDNTTGYNVINTTTMFMRVLNIVKDNSKKPLLHFHRNGKNLCETNMKDVFEETKDVFIKCGDVKTEDDDENLGGIYQ